jgi:hypothetical protein
MDEPTHQLSEREEPSLEGRLFHIASRESPPGVQPYLRTLKGVTDVLINEAEEVRPRDHVGLPGGILELRKDLPTVIVPDLHARMDFFLSMLCFSPPEDASILQKLAADEIQVICVGDGFHAEGRAAARWEKAYEEYRTNFRRHRSMDEEMTESLGVMEMVMEVKSAYPRGFHFLKGNHENVANEQGNGNYPFRKYAYEGPMVAQYVHMFYGEEFFEAYYDFEKNLPLFGIGRNFLVSHAEPADFFDRESILEYRSRPDVVEGLTWTANDEADDHSVARMIEYYLGEDARDGAYYFGGHRPVNGRFAQRAEGKYVQIHNPDRFIIALLNPDQSIDLERDVKEIEPVMQSNGCAEKSSGAGGV